jgi:hypothetical protein
VFYLGFEKKCWGGSQFYINKEEQQPFFFPDRNKIK